MKKILLAFSGVLCALSLNAQTFTIPADTVKWLYVSGLDEIHSNITNITSAPIVISWNVVPSATDFPASWIDANALGICDNSTCYQNTGNVLTSGTVFQSVDYAPNAVGDFHLALDLTSGVPGTHYMTIDLVNGTYSRKVVFQVSKFATSVANVKRSSDAFNLYPNPAKDALYVNYSGTEKIKEVSVFNLIGRKIASYPASTNTVKLDIATIPSGMYYVRLMDAQGQVVGTRRFTHQ